MKIANVVGARPQFMKYFPISQAMEKSGVEDILIHTGQHYDYQMSEIFFNEFGMKKPDHHLGVGSGKQGKQTAQVIEKIEEVFLEQKPDFVLIYGDTNSTLGAAVAAAKMHIPIGHVEAGLRSFNKYMPEEVNRIIADHVSTMLFCPSQTAIDNLKHEGIDRVWEDGKLVDLEKFCKVIKQQTKVDKNHPLVLQVGDVMFDLLLYALENNDSKILENLKLQPGQYDLMTLHRAENTDRPDKLHEIIQFVNETSSGRKVIFPIHPRTRKAYKDSKVRFADNINIIEPVGYFDNVKLLKNASLAMTDSGGLQKEAYWAKTPCITLREETEWVETIDIGWNVLYKNYQGKHDSLSKETRIYGDGEAATKIIETAKAVINQ